MPKLTGPLLSLSARGTFGPRMTFSMRKTGAQVRIQKAQKNIVTVKNSFYRYFYNKYKNQWLALTIEQKDVFNDRAKQLKMTGYNLYLKEQLAIKKLGYLRNINGAVGDIAITTAGYIEDPKYKIGLPTGGGVASFSAKFDTAVKRTGSKSLKLSTLNATGKLLGATYGLTINANDIFPVKPSTKYRLSCYAKTNNVGTNGVYTAFREVNSVLATVTTQNLPSESRLSGTKDWTLLSFTFTTNANTAFGAIFFYNYVAGNVSSAWFDIDSCLLEVV